MNKLELISLQVGMQQRNCGGGRSASRSTTMSQEEEAVTRGKSAASGVLSSLRIVLFVIGTIVIALAALCNWLTWHLQNFWGGSRDFWQAQWDKVLWRLGDDPATYWIYGTTYLTFAVYWLVGGLYSLLDLTGALRRYKIQPGTNEPVAPGQLARVIAQVLFNQLAVGLPVAHLGYKLILWRGFPPLRQLPTFHVFLAHLAFHILCEELGFYYSHRLLHSRSFYRHVHKQHHQWTAPVAVTAIYCHPLEHVASNLLPPFVGPLILGSHVATAWLWFSLAILSTLNAHCGYHLPFFPSPEAHDFHHLKFNQCYGVLGMLDRLHGTDALFRRTKSYRRHLMLLSLRPARQAFPEADECQQESKAPSTLSSRLLQLSH